MIKSDEQSQRQVLVNVGNRYVVFGPSPGLPQKLQFDPDKDSEIFPRVADESEVAATRIIQSLRVNNMMRIEGPENNESGADIVLRDNQGQQTLIEIKVRNHEPKQRDLESTFERIKAAASSGEKLEIWHFNIERLNLLVQYYDRSMPQFSELPPQDVWEKTDEGVFRRDKVVQEVEGWEGRIRALYAQVQDWVSDQPQLRLDNSRTVTLSEELMQKFAVSDRELPVLDILRNDDVVASFVPRGLWLIGAWGRVDIITQTHTRILVVTKDDQGAYEWGLVSPESRRNISALSKATLLSILVDQ